MRWKPATVRTLIFYALLLISIRSTGQSSPLLTFSFDKVTLQRAFKEIENQTGFAFFYNTDDLKGRSKVSLTVKSASLEEVLRLVLKGQHLAYSMRGRNIFISEESAQPASSSAKDQPVLPLSTDARNGNTVYGRVTDSAGTPLAGASVTVKGNQSGMQTGMKGDYVLTGLPDNATLVISFTGYVKKEIPVDHRSEINVVLKENHNPLDNVVVLAYGNTTQRKSTGNVSTVSAADIAAAPISNALEILQGRVPGLIVTPSSGFFSAGYSVKIRGSNTIPTVAVPQTVSDPLYVIDGIPITVGNGDPLGQGMNQNGILGPANGQNPLLWLNPSDILSISILKDADATAIYGARGANGVILITTKTGKPGKTTLDINVFDGTSIQAHKLHLLNTPQYLSMRHEAFNNDQLTPDNGSAYDLLVWDTTRSTDWQKEVLSTAQTKDAQVSVSGGDEKTTFRLNAGHHYQTPPFPGSFSEQRTSGMLTLGHSEFDRKLKTTLSINVSGIKSDLPQSDPTWAIFNAPDAPAIYAKDGSLNYNGWRPGTYPGIFAALKQPYKASTFNLASNLNIAYSFTPGLSLSLFGGYNLTSQNQTLSNPGIAQDPNSVTVRTTTFGENQVHTWIFEPNIRWTTPLAGKGKLSTLIGATLQESIIEGNSIEGLGFVNDDQMENRAAASSFSNANSNYTQTKFQSLYGRINYELADRYILSLNMRRDGSSRFGPANQFGNFGSLAAAWIFSEEASVKQTLPFLSFGKLRGSYGLTGGDAIGDYAYLSTLTYGYTPYQSSPTLLLTTAANPNYKWTVNRKLDLSVDLGFFQDRILVNASFFRNRCGNQLVSYPLPTFTGFTSVINNLSANVQNQGFEFSLTTRNFEGKNFSWSTNANISISRNKLISFPGLANSSYSTVYQIGQSIDRTELFHFLGVDPATGYYKIEDKNQDGSIDYITDQDFYNSDPSFTGGMGNNIRYKRWSLNFFFLFAKQKGFNNAFNSPPGFINSNQPASILGRWQKSGDQSDIGGFTTQYRDDINYYLQSDGLWADASYVRLQNASLSYDFPTTAKGMRKLSLLRVSLQGENLWTLSGYKGTDPQNPVTGIVLPVRTIVTGRLQITF